MSYVEIPLAQLIQQKIDEIYKATGSIINVIDSNVYVDNQFIFKTSTFGNLNQIYTFLIGWTLGWNKGLKLKK